MEILKQKPGVSPFLFFPAELEPVRRTLLASILEFNSVHVQDGYATIIHGPFVHVWYILTKKVY
jgi:hypothetical protein